MMSDNDKKKISELELEVEHLQKALAIARRDKQNVLDALLLTPVALCHHDKQLRYTWLHNPHLGFVTDEVLGKTDKDILDDELAERLMTIKQRVLNTGIGERLEVPNVLGDEDAEFFDLIVEPLRDRDTREITGLVCGGIDITEERHRREAYKQSEEKLRFIFNASPMPILVLHYEKGTPLFFNQAAAELFNLSVDALSEQNDCTNSTNLFRQLDLEDIIQSRVDEEHNINQLSIRHINRYQEEIFLSVSATYIYYNNEAAVLTTFHDQTAQLKIERQLQQWNAELEQRVEERTAQLKEAKIAAEKASEAKSQFLANMSHEIRTPMNGVLGIADMLQDSELTNTQRHYVRTIQSSGKTLIAVINDILDYSKAEAGELKLENRPFDLSELIEDCITPYRLISSTAVELLATIDPDVPTSIKGDSIRLQQVIANLLNNAFKFTHDGYITLRVALRETHHASVTLEFSIIDTGIGINSKDKQHLFQPFCQADASTTRKYGGTGLGLAICKQLVTQMGGTIDFYSTPGRGSHFFFCVRLDRSNDRQYQAAQKKQRLSFSGKRILLADQQLCFHDILIQQAQTLGIQLEAVPDSKQMTATLIKALRQKTAPDLLLLDLPDCFDLSDETRQLIQRHKLPCILLTSSVPLPIQQELEQHGFLGAQFKPSSKEQLALLLRDVFVTDNCKSATANHLKQNQETPLRVLLAEDNPVNRFVADGLLRKMGIKAIQVSDGALAVKIVCHQQQRFDLILMDCEMPKLDGYAATEQIRRWEKNNGRPATIIYALTAHALQEHIKKCNDAGMNGHLAKPISSEQLRSTIEKVRRQIRSENG